jgi:arsenate reductase (thioredoxin)
MTTNVLILCTHNSARSVLGEGMLNHWARKLGKAVRAYSAGSTPSGRINPLALEALADAGVDTACDSAAAEACPYWPGGPVKAHWGYPDPSNAAEADRKAAFELTRQAISYRMLQLLALPVETMSDRELQSALLDISRN